MIPRWKFITLTNDKKVEGWFQAEEDQEVGNEFINFDFKNLNTGEKAKKIAFVNNAGQKINIT